MDLFQIYKEFLGIKAEIISLIEDISDNDMKDCTDQNISNSLLGEKNKLEFMKIKVDDVEVTEDNIEMVNQLKMSIMDALFLLVDLLKFYHSASVERFRMRVYNYVNKDRMERFIKDNPFESNISFGNCRVDK